MQCSFYFEGLLSLHLVVLLQVVAARRQLEKTLKIASEMYKTFQFPHKYPNKGIISILLEIKLLLEPSC